MTAQSKESGYVLFACKSNNNEQVQAAYVLALSIKCVDTRPIALVVDSFETVPTKYEKAFDFIVEMPYGSSEYLTGSPVSDVWQIYYATPFEKNLYIKHTSLLMDNIDHIWDSLNGFDLVFPTNTNNFQGNKSTYLERNEIQQRNNLPVYYSDVIYFEKQQATAEFFKMCDPLFKNWRAVFGQFAKKGTPEWFSLDQMISIATTSMGITPVHYYNHLTYTDIGVDNILTDDTDIPDLWIDFFNIWLYKGRVLKVNNHRQTGIVVYNHPKFITKENINELTNRYKEIQRYAN